MAEEKKDSQIKPMLVDRTESSCSISLTRYNHSGIEPTRADVIRNPLSNSHWSNDTMRATIATSLFINQCLNDPLLGNLTLLMENNNIFPICKKYLQSNSTALYRRMDIQSPQLTFNNIYYNDGVVPMGTLYVVHVCPNLPLRFSPTFYGNYIHTLLYLRYTATTTTKIWECPRRRAIVGQILFVPKMAGLAEIIKIGEVEYALNIFWGSFHNATITGSMPILLDCESATEKWCEQIIMPFDQLWWTKIEIKWKTSFTVQLTKTLFPESNDGYGRGHFGEIWNWT